jgi:DNA segregation ATPase FtsK/SpoIIIE-like protein
MNFIRENNSREFDAELEDLILNGPPPENAAAGFGDGPSAARNQDPMYLPVLRWLVREENLQRSASISGVQRQFGLGFGRAGKIIDQLAAAGFVSAGNGAKVREVLVSKEEIDNIYGPE